MGNFAAKINLRPNLMVELIVKYKNWFIGLAIAALFYFGSSYLYEGQEESRAFYAKRHVVSKNHR